MVRVNFLVGLRDKPYYKTLSNKGDTMIFKTFLFKDAPISVIKKGHKHAPLFYSLAENNSDSFVEIMGNDDFFVALWLGGSNTTLFGIAWDDAIDYLTNRCANIDKEDYLESEEANDLFNAFKAFIESQIINAR